MKVMEMAQDQGEGSSQGRKQRSHYFWTNNDPQTSHFFFKVLLPGFETTLAIPRKFVNMFGAKFSEVVVLKGQDYNASSVKLRRTGDDVFFADGWQQFAKENHFEEYDFLVFQYDERNNEMASCFHVLAFDKSACQKEVVKNVQRNNDQVLNFSDSESETLDLNKSGKDADYDNQEKKSSFQEETSVGVPSRTAKYNRYYESGRRPVTEDEIQKAFKSATAAKSNKPNFIAVMKPSHVYRRFFLSLPKKFTIKYFDQIPEFVFLRVPPSTKTWRVAIVWIENGVRAGISAGWANFVMDNNLEEGDTCLFEWYIREGETTVNANNTVAIDVSIYRVVKQIVPLRKVRP